MKRKLTEQQTRDAHKYYMEDRKRTIRDTANYFDCGYTTLRNSFIRYKLEVKSLSTRRRVQTYEQAQEMHQFYMAEPLRTMKQTADHYEVGSNTVFEAFRRFGLTPKSNGRSGEYHHMWKGGRRANADGYIRVRVVPDDPLYSMADHQGYVLEHRYVMAQYLGRVLFKGETVHHIDGDKANNDITNLQLRIGGHGQGQVYGCMDCGSDRIEPKEIADGEMVGD